MSNRALRELRSLPLFQWEASARSSDHPAHGELLNMPTYDVVRVFNLIFGVIIQR